MTSLKTVLALGALLLGTQAMAVSYDKNISQELRTQMDQDLAFVAQLQGEGQTKFHQEIFGQVNGPSYATFFDSRIKRVGLHTCGSAMAVACVIPSFDPNKMWMTQNYIKFSHPQIARLMVVFHESRHSETQNGNWMHADCPVPFLDANGKDKTSIWTGAKLEGEPACDSTYKGAYGSSTVMMKNISKFCTSCNEKVKMDADVYAMDQLERVNREDVKRAMLNDFAGN